MEDPDDMEVVFANEYSAKERCQQLGIQIDKARKGAGVDRFKYLCLITFLHLRATNGELFGNDALQSFFEGVVPRLQAVESKNPVCCVLAAVCGVVYNPKDGDVVVGYTPSKEVMARFAETIIPSNELFFKKNGVGIVDVVRYVRMFQQRFSPSSSIVPQDLG